MAPKLPSTIKPMLGKMSRQPFDSPDFIYELKWDGMRALASSTFGRSLGVSLRYWY